MEEEVGVSHQQRPGGRRLPARRGRRLHRPQQHQLRHCGYPLRGRRGAAAGFFSEGPGAHTKGLVRRTPAQQVLQLVAAHGGTHAPAAAELKGKQALGRAAGGRREEPKGPMGSCLEGVQQVGGGLQHGSKDVAIVRGRPGGWREKVLQGELPLHSAQRAQRESTIVSTCQELFRQASQGV